MNESIVNDDAPVFKASFETHVFPNSDGSITILQKCLPNDDAIIVIPVEQISNVVRALQRAKKELQE